MNMGEKRILPNSVVTLSYFLEIDGKETPEWFSRPMRINFIFGRDPLMPLIERAIAGAKEGERLSISIPPEQAYGHYDENLIREIPLKDIKHPDQLKEGEYYQEITPSGRQVMFLVKEIKESSVLADFNHPAAGHRVIMNISVEEVRKPSTYDLMICDARNCGSG